ncbi:uncharacterized protein LOC144477450 [Augochlora pura]
MTGPKKWSLKILQINLHRCKLAQDLMTQYVMENGIEIVAISEPYRCHTSWATDINQDAAIWATPVTSNENKITEDAIKEKGVVAISIDKVKIFSCYISPNIEIGEFQDILAVLENGIVKVGADNSIIMGDFNAKSISWGSKLTDRRGYEILEMSARNNISPVRSQGRFTFDRDGHTSLIDIILCGKKCVEALKSSVILGNYTASGHRYLRHIFESNDKHVQRDNTTGLLNKTKFNIDKFTDNLHEWAWTRDTFKLTDKNDADEYIRKVTKLVSLARQKNHPSCRHKKAAWWWNEKTRLARSEVIKARRSFQRAKTRRTTADETDRLKKTYIDKKRAKNYDYHRTTLEEVYIPASGVDETDDDFNEAEVKRAVKKIKKKALGLDFVPAEAVRVLGEEDSYTLTQFINCCYNSRYIKYEDNQYGFRKGKSTIHAVDKIIKL